MQAHINLIVGWMKKKPANIMMLVVGLERVLLTLGITVTDGVYVGLVKMLYRSLQRYIIGYSTSPLHPCQASETNSILNCNANIMHEAQVLLM